MKKLIRQLFLWIFAAEVEEMKQAAINAKKAEMKSMEALVKANQRQQYLSNLLSNIDIGVDVHENYHQYSPNWGVISIQGEKADFIKFIRFGDRDMRQIQTFLRKFDRKHRVKIDASPTMSGFMKM